MHASGDAQGPGDCPRQGRWADPEAGEWVQRGQYRRRLPARPQAYSEARARVRRCLLRGADRVSPRPVPVV